MGIQQAAGLRLTGLALSLTLTLRVATLRLAGALSDARGVKPNLVECEGLTCGVCNPQLCVVKV